MLFYFHSIIGGLGGNNWQHLSSLKAIYIQ